MFEQITFAKAQDSTWDVVIAGSSFAAMFFLKGLRPELRILVVEKGAVRSHTDRLAKGEDANQQYQMLSTAAKEKDWIAKTTFGGNSNCWWGQTPRFHPNDFRLSELYGQGATWPIGYHDLEPYYARVEQVMDIAGGGGEALFPRSSKYPFPPHAVMRSDAICISEFPDIWMPSATARSNGGARSQCCGTGVCRLCPIDSKFTILNAIDRFERPNTALLLNAELRQVDITNGTATGVIVATETSDHQRIRCNAVALGTNAINNAAILLRSGRSDAALGRYLHEQVGRGIEVNTSFPGYFGGTSITALCYGHYDGAHRKDSAAVMIESVNTTPTIRAERGKWTHRMRLKMIAEDLPQRENRVTLDDKDEVLIHWAGHSDYALRGLARAEENLCDVLPEGCEPLPSLKNSATEAHIQGTHRMGRDPKTSVVNQWLQLHASNNVYALGAGVFPTCSPANPTLTLSALSLRAGERL